MEPETEAPWLCVAGRDSKIKVYDVIRGTLVKVNHRFPIESAQPMLTKGAVLFRSSLATGV
jgi:hypothetical protein